MSHKEARKCIAFCTIPCTPGGDYTGSTNSKLKGPPRSYHLGLPEVQIHGVGLRSVLPLGTCFVPCSSTTIQPLYLPLELLLETWYGAWSPHCDSGEEKGLRVSSFSLTCRTPFLPAENQNTHELLDLCVSWPGKQCSVTALQISQAAGLCRMKG